MQKHNFPLSHHNQIFVLFLDVDVTLQTIYILLKMFKQLFVKIFEQEEGRTRFPKRKHKISDFLTIWKESSKLDLGGNNGGV